MVVLKISQYQIHQSVSFEYTRTGDFKACAFFRSFLLLSVSHDIQMNPAPAKGGIMDPLNGLYQARYHLIVDP